MLPTGYIAKPKEKERRRRGALQIDTIVDAVSPGGIRLVCATVRSWTKRRLEVFARDKERCRKCHRRISPKVMHAPHLSKRKAGGGFRDDRRFNLLSLCSPCHREVEDHPELTVEIAGLVKFLWCGKV